MLDFLKSYNLLKVLPDTIAKSSQHIYAYFFILEHLKKIYIR